MRAVTIQWFAIVLYEALRSYLIMKPRAPDVCHIVTSYLPEGRSRGVVLSDEVDVRARGLESACIRMQFMPKSTLLICGV